MSKQVYIVKNSKGQVIGAEQSKYTRTHALVIKGRAEMFAGSQAHLEQIAAEDHAHRVCDIVPVECIGAVKPVTLTVEEYDVKVRTFHAYKYAVVNIRTGDLQGDAKRSDALHYTLEQAQAYAATATAIKPSLKLFVMKVIDPRA